MYLPTNSGARRQDVAVLMYAELLRAIYGFITNYGTHVNSIRHNLSLYSIFEREQSKKHGSHWTIRDDSPDRAKVPPPKKAERMSPLPSCLPVTFIPHQSGSNSSTPVLGKTGLQPILPRPNPNSTPLQTYALIPIQSLSAGGSQSSPLLPDINQRTKKQVASKSKRKKCVNIAPKVSQQSLLRQAWLNAQALVSDSDTEKSAGMREVEDPLDGLDCVKRSKTNSGLPKPKIYNKKTPPRKAKTRRKQKLVPKERELMHDSSDEEVNFIAAIEKDVPSSKSTENSQPDENVSTSTPFKSKILSSPQFLSPIRGLTPLRSSNILDSSLLDCLKESDNEGIRNILGSPDLLFSKKLSPSNVRSPNMSLLFSGLTPVKGDTDNENNDNLSSLLAEIEEEDMPANLSNISWNTLCQNINPDHC
ncbi:hypothetical protein FSP39_004032 [Pinctada imbricata]|uniref:Fork-head domain-containing protein n=1 Tax=Pinctada imbricata TaxID=66713 RepID=A0AA88YPS3_PINIB|nr:hypothetical protein FSP39_004032 [Pinctada imbricata]